MVSNAQDPQDEKVKNSSEGAKSSRQEGLGKSSLSAHCSHGQPWCGVRF